MFGTTHPDIIRARQILDEIMAIQPIVGDFPPTEDEQAILSRQVYNQRLTIIYVALVNVAAEARGGK